jgi:hypothetical protein
MYGTYQKLQEPAHTASCGGLAVVILACYFSRSL